MNIFGAMIVAEWLGYGRAWLGDWKVRASGGRGKGEGSCLCDGPNKRKGHSISSKAFPAAEREKP